MIKERVPLCKPPQPPSLENIPNLPNSPKGGTLSRIPMLSAFGRIWTRLSNLVTAETRSFFLDSEYVESCLYDQEVLVARLDIFSKRVVKVMESVYKDSMRQVDYRDDMASALC